MWPGFGIHPFFDPHFEIKPVLLKIGNNLRPGQTQTHGKGKNQHLNSAGKRMWR